MPRGVSRSAIRAERNARMKQAILDIDSALPDGLKSFMSMIKHDVQHDDMQMAAARCISMANKLDMAPIVREKLAGLLPGYGDYLNTRNKK